LKVYLDSSVLLRVVLGEPERLPIWPKITAPITSELVRLECLRTIDRARIRLGLDDATVATRRRAILEAIESLQLISIDRRVLERAAEPFPTSLGSLDAIHLASALLARDQIEGLSLATHDVELGLAAQSMGFSVYGLPASL
jgi:predicted nucleic acid-binding protein